MKNAMILVRTTVIPIDSASTSSSRMATKRWPKGVRVSQAQNRTPATAATAMAKSRPKPLSEAPPNQSGGTIWLMPVSPFVNFGKKMNASVSTDCMTSEHSVK